LLGDALRLRSRRGRHCAGLDALIFGAKLPDWVDPIMGRVVGLTLVILGVWVFVSLYNYVRHGGEFRSAQPAGCSSSPACGTRGAASRRGSMATSTSSRWR
jgi:hypothetical protein